MKYLFLLKIPTFSALRFQNANAPLIEELIFFHDHIITALIIITVIVSYNIISIITNLNIDKTSTESQSLEIFWTVAPTLVLIFIGIPSIRILYILDEVYSPLISIKINGHQWYWSYEFTNFQNIEFDSFMLRQQTNQTNIIRLLDVDTRLIIPFNTQIRCLLTAADVLHAWTIPRLGVKADAIPGRLNQINFIVNRPGLYLGQCSEICGANHSFMPIIIEAISPEAFIKWTKTQ